MSERVMFEAGRVAGFARLSPTYRLASGRRVRFSAGHLETADSALIAEMRGSRLYGSAFRELKENPAEKARTAAEAVERATLLERENAELKERLSEAQQKRRARLRGGRAVRGAVPPTDEET